MLARDDTEHALPVSLRVRFQELIAAFVAGDFQLSTSPLEGVAPIAAEMASTIGKSLAGHGDALAPLRDEVWATSLYRWMDGYWQVLIDLSTAHEPVSDLVLHAKVVGDGGFPIEVQSVHVP